VAEVAEVALAADVVAVVVQAVYNKGLSDFYNQ
jgi:hypothetical protein